MTSLPVIPFATEKITGCTNEVAKGANSVPRNQLSCFFISCFTVPVPPSINHFPALTAPVPLILLSNLFITFEATFEAALRTNPDKYSLVIFYLIICQVYLNHL